MWHLKTFDQLSTNELFSLLKERVAVFVVEQECPYPEIDDLDKEALHLFKLDNQGQVLAYCRLIPTASQVKLGRVLVSQAARKSGLGKELVAQALTVCQDKFPELPVFAQAQTYLQDFYASFGFRAISQAYLEDNIPHIDMLRDKETYDKL